MKKRPIHTWYPQKGPSIELWEMPYHHIQNVIGFIEAKLKGDWKHAKACVRRPWELRIKFLQRELRYREDIDYRNLQTAVRKNPNDSTLLLILADRCQELGCYVTERRLRRKAESLFKESHAQDRQREPDSLVEG